MNFQKVRASNSYKAVQPSTMCVFYTYGGMRRYKPKKFIPMWFEIKDMLLKAGFREVLLYSDLFFFKNRLEDSQSYDQCLCYTEGLEIILRKS